MPATPILAMAAREAAGREQAWTRFAVKERLKAALRQRP